MIAFAAVAPKSDLFLEVDHLDSDRRAIQRASTDMGILQRRTSFAGGQAIDYIHRHKSTATSGDESSSALKTEEVLFFQ